MEEDTLALSTFGSSLSLTTTLRHSIQSEITTLDHALSSLSKSIAAETSIHRGIMKEMERAKREMTELKRGGGDVVECNAVEGNVNRGWKEGEMKEIASSLDGFSVVSDDEESLRYIPGKLKELRVKQQAVRGIGKELEAAKVTLKELNEETVRISGESERLNPKNGQVQGELEKRKIELEGEVRRNVRVKEAIGRSRQNSGAYARGIADKAQEQVTQRSTNLSKESTLQTDLDAKNQDLTRLSAEEKKLDAELSMLSGLLESFIQQHVEAEGETEKCAELKVELEELQSETSQLTKVKEDKVKIQDVAAKSLEEAKKIHEAASAGAKELEASKIENDKDDAKVMQPAVTEKAELGKEKEELVSEMGELHKEMAELQGKMNEAAAGTDAKATIKAEELKNYKEQLQKAQSNLEEFLKKATAEEEGNAKELQETKDFQAHLEAATQGEITRLDSMKRQKTDERLTKLDQRRSELASLEDVKREEINHLKDARALWDEIKDVEASIKEAEIELTEDGDELLPAIEEHKEVFADLKARIESDENEGGNGDDRDDMVTQASPSAKRRL